MPRLDLAQRAFLKSLAKLAACHEHNVGLVRDRANFAAGDMDNVPSSGLFCLALAAASRQGLVATATARRVLGQVNAVVADPARVPRCRGLLPHFVRWEPKERCYVAYAPDRPGKPGLCSEFSTVDSALYYQSMLLAAQMLDQPAITRQLLADIHQIDFVPLVVQRRVVDSHGQWHTLRLIDGGYTYDGKLLGQVWDNWGGEGALVVALARLAGYQGPLEIDNPYQPPGTSGAPGAPYDGTGFIAEIQSLFYPEFSSDRPDALTGVDWLAARRAVLAEQIACTGRFGATPAERLGLYGYSAGEGPDGEGYLVNGTRRGWDAATKQYDTRPLIYPHYIFMSACTPASLAGPRTALENLEKSGLFPPLSGLVENFDVQLKRPLALLGSLDAAFDTLGAYHFLCREENQPDGIYAAAEASAPLRAAVRDFYPEP
jgi:hypothetical protein